MEKEYLKHTNYKEYIKMEGNFKYYDFKLIDNDDKTHYIEIKADRQTRNTNNIFIEYECNGKPSGISSTQAHKIIYFENYPTKESLEKYNEETRGKTLNYYQKKNMENQILEFENDYIIYELNVDSLKEMIKNRDYGRNYEGIIEGKKMKGYLFNKSLFKKQIIHNYNNLDLTNNFTIII